MHAVAVVPKGVCWSCCPSISNVINSLTSGKSQPCRFALWFRIIERSVVLSQLSPASPKQPPLNLP